MQTEYFQGKDGYIWWHGVVEDRKDPLFLGRCRVRILGWHTANKTELPTDQLPWAQALMPITSASQVGVGQAPVGPVEGTWVIGFFRDGENCQEPIVMGTIGGYPMEKPKPTGFNDPNKVYPKETHLIEPDTHRRGRRTFKFPPDMEEAESKPTPLDTEGGREEDKEVIIALEPAKWDEPENPFDAAYPFNHVRASESGHTEEWDDTVDHERLMTWHKSGTFEEIRETGTKVTKIQRDNYRITLGSDFIHVKPNVNELHGYDDGGNMYITVDGNAHLKVGGDYKMEVTGNWIVQVGKDWTVDVMGNTQITTAGTKLDESGGVHTIKGSVIHLNP